MANEEPEDKKKAHRKPHSGRKAEKKAKKNVILQGDKQKNPKAFGFNSAVRAERRFRRNQDLETKKQHIPLVDRTPLEPPPVIVAVVGPPKVGKSTLIQCLIKNFTRTPLTSIKGPITFVSGKKRRLTIIECNNDINSMIDIAKVADLVLLLVDASFGFEMEIFEFLNICQVHGMPRVMGVLTHLDMLKHNKQLKRVKKTLKHRFWTEVYDGAKLFYLSGLLHGEYLRNEIKNLGRFISVIKFRPLVWRTSHPYILVDRLEDITSPEMIRQNPVVDRDICLYGFVRGIPLNKKYSIHIPGCGDFKVKDVVFLPDPCPLPEKEKKRRLVEKEKLMYAPFSGVGGIVYDKDAVYVELGGSHSHSQEEKKPALVSGLLEVQQPLDEKMTQSQLQLFSDARPITGEDVLGGGRRYYEEAVDDADTGRKRRKVVFTAEEKGADSDDEMSDEEENNDGGDDDVKGSDSSEGSENEEEPVPFRRESKATYSWENKEGEEEGGTVYMKSVSKVTNKSEGKHHSVDNIFSGKSSMSSSSLSKNRNSNSNSNDINAKLKQLMGDDLDDFEVASGDESDDSDVGDDGSNNGASGDESDDDDDDDMSFINSHAEKKTQGEERKINAPKTPKEKLVNEDDKKNFHVRSKIAECLASIEERSVPLNRLDLERMEVEGEEPSGSDDEEGETGSAHSDQETSLDPTVQWKANLKERAANAYFERQANSFSLWKLVYGETEGESVAAQGDDAEELGGLFRKVSAQQKQQQEQRDMQDGRDSSKSGAAPRRDWADARVLDSIADCFVTGKWRESDDADELLRLDAASVSGESDVYGDFEDLETGEKHVSKDVDDASKSDSKPKVGEKHELSKKEIIEKKKKLKEKFDAEYDEGEGGHTFYDELKQLVNRQAEINKSEFEGLEDEIRVQLEGFRPGMYVRVELSQMPCELITNFDPTYPLIIGGLLTGEENTGNVQVRMKKHRWFKKILKNSDPLIVSLGWRRFQTIPVFAKLEDNLRHRYLKYTPEHVSCIAHFWGPITPQGTGFLAVQDTSSKEAGFRIAATGSVVELDKSVQVMKKLKLTGVPLKVYKKTAFIQGMFNTSLEVAKFEGAKVRTVSGIRGQIKRGVAKPEGCFRATFEDKIKMSDIVFCRTWFRVSIPKLYNPVLTLLLPPEQKNAWRGMKTVGQLRRERGVLREAQSDSLYTPIHRKPRAFQPVVIPSRLQKMLPYKDKPKIPAQSARKAMAKKRVAVIHDVSEQKVAKLMRMLKVARKYKTEKDEKAVKKKKEERRKEIENEEMKLLRRRKELKKRVFRELDKMKSKRTSSAK